jgi:hypothetical protein
MSTRPAPVRITDFADPQFPPEIAELRASLAPLAETVRLEPDAVMAEAAARTGLDDFGDRGFEQRLAVFLRAADTEAGLAPFGRISTQALAVNLLKNRLLLEDLLKRHPEIHDIPIDRPIIICGLPRTGTTHLHNLMSADPNLRSLPYWESLEPVPVPGEEPGPDGEDPRITRTKQGCDFLNATMPLFKRMHEMTWDHVHEEIQLLAIDWSTMLFETVAPVPSWRDYYLSHDQTPHYEYLKTILKALTFLRGGRRWLLKSPQHIEQFAALRRVFPDATYVVTHRDPVAVTTSMLVMLAYSARMNVAHPEPTRYGALWAPRLELMLRACADQRDLLPDAQTIDVRFDEFMADDIAMVRRVYEVADQPFTEATRAAMVGYMAEHPRGRHGGVEYHLEEFGVDHDERRAALAFYSDRFGVTLES